MDNGRYLYVLLSVQGLRLQVDLVAENYGKILLRRKAVLMQMTYPGPALPGGVSFEAFWEETSPLLLEFEVVGCGLRDRVKRAGVLLRAWGVRLVLKRLRYRDLSELAGRCYGLAYCSSTDLCSAAGIAPIPAVPGAEEFRKIAGYFERRSPLSDTSLIPETAQLDTAPRRQRVITRRQRPQQREQALSLRGRHVVLVGTFRTGTREEVRSSALFRRPAQAAAPGKAQDSLGEAGIFLEAKAPVTDLPLPLACMVYFLKNEMRRCAVTDESQNRKTKFQVVSPRQCRHHHALHHEGPGHALLSDHLHPEGGGGPAHSAGSSGPCDGGVPALKDGAAEGPLLVLLR